MTLKLKVHLNQTLVTEPRAEGCPHWEGSCICIGVWVGILDVREKRSERAMGPTT
jgi:hypothetical protein